MYMCVCGRVRLLFDVKKVILYEKVN